MPLAPEYQAMFDELAAQARRLVLPKFPLPMQSRLPSYAADKSGTVSWCHRKRSDQWPLWCHIHPDISPWGDGLSALGLLSWWLGDPAGCLR